MLQFAVIRGSGLYRDQIAGKLAITEEGVKVAQQNHDWSIPCLTEEVKQAQTKKRAHSWWKQFNSHY